MNWWARSTKNFVKILIYIEHFLIFASAITRCVLITAFASLVGFYIGMTSSAIGLKIWAITAALTVHILVVMNLLQ